MYNKKPLLADFKDKVPEATLMERYAVYYTMPDNKFSIFISCDFEWDREKEQVGKEFFVLEPSRKVDGTLNYFGETYKTESMDYNQVLDGFKWCIDLFDKDLARESIESPFTMDHNVELELAVTFGQTAGRLEAEGKIKVQDQQDLYAAVQDVYKEYCNNPSETNPFIAEDISEKILLDRFSPERAAKQEAPQHPPLPATPTAFEGTLRLAPEQVALYNDILSLSMNQLKEKYDELGDSFDHEVYLGQGYKGLLSIEMPGDLNLRDQPGVVALYVYRDTGKHPREEPFKAYFSATSVQDDFTLNADDGSSFTIRVEEDPSLKRVGSQMKFCYDGMDTDELYAPHNGEICSITRALNTNECDILAVGPMYKATFPNGDTLDVFDYELAPLAPTKEKTRLSDQIQAAEEKRESGGTQSPGREEDLTK